MLDKRNWRVRVRGRNKKAAEVVWEGKKTHRSQQSWCLLCQIVFILDIALHSIILSAAIISAYDTVTLPNNLHLGEVFPPYKLYCFTVLQNKTLVQKVAAQSSFTNCICGVLNLSLGDHRCRFMYVFSSVCLQPFKDVAIRWAGNTVVPVSSALFSESRGCSSCSLKGPLLSCVVSRGNSDIKPQFFSDVSICF